MDFAAWLQALAHKRMLSDLVSLSALLVGLSLLAASSAFADVKLPAVIGSNMVLQRGIKVPIWGTAEPGERVTVTFRDQRVSATADTQGRWLAKLKPLEPGGPFEMTVAGKNTIALRNIMVGDVWVCSGQSNMEYSVQGLTNAQQEIAAADYPQIRLCYVKHVTAEQPLTGTEASWQVCAPATVPGFSAVAYLFARELHKELGVPVGLIGTYWGGSPAEAWTSRPTLEADPSLKAILDGWQQELANYQKAKASYDRQLAEWQQAADKAKAEGKPAPSKPNPPGGPGWQPASLYNGMIAPLLPYAIKGAIWYQGESNAGRAYEYRKLFPAMIQDWRRAWGQGDFPFLFVQLPNFMAVKPDPSESEWAELREAQLMTLSLRNTGMAVAIDVGEANDIHPKSKLDVSHRLALAALGTVYGRDVVYYGPIYRSMSVKGNQARLRFKHVGSGLVAKGGEPLKGFAIAGEDRKFVWAEAKIEGNAVVVSSAQVPKPVAVRYAWADNPVCNLYNKAGLPASPFRTDDWPGLTANR